jgi:hypothetical protein
MSDAVRRSAGGSARFEAWVGTVSEIGALVRRMEEVLHEKREAVLVEFDRETEQVVRTWAEGRLDPEAVAAQRREERMRERAELEKKLAPVMTVAERDLQKLEGSPEDVLASMDRRVVASLGVEAPPYGLYRARDNRIVLRLDSEEGARLSVSGDDPDWVRKAVSVLSLELEKGKPRWTWLRGERGSAFASATTALAALLFFREPLADASGASLFFGVVYLTLFAGLIGMAMHSRIIKKRLPGFELIEPGQESKGRQAVVFTAALLLQIPAGVVSAVLVD